MAAASAALSKRQDPFAELKIVQAWASTDTKTSVLCDELFGTIASFLDDCDLKNWCLERPGEKHLKPRIPLNLAQIQTLFNQRLTTHPLQPDMYERLLNCTRLPQEEIDAAQTSLDNQVTTLLPAEFFDSRRLWSQMPARFPKLTSLKLHSFNNDQFSDLRTLSLQKLDLSYCSGITDAGLAHLSALRLKELNLSSCDVTDAGLAHLSALPLQKLDLSYCSKVTDAGLTHLSALRLRELHLTHCKHITDAGLAHLSTLPLQRLSLTHCKRITDAGLAHLRNCPLQLLDLAACELLTDTGLAHLSPLPLQILDLSNCEPITDAGLAHLSALPLQILCLCDSDCITDCENITDAGLAHLSTLPLQILDLSTCSRITERGLAYLRALSLQRLFLCEHANIPPVAIEQFRAAHPNLVLKLE